jgi:hypothetical protein
MNSTSPLRFGSLPLRFGAGVQGEAVSRAITSIAATAAAVT